MTTDTENKDSTENDKHSTENENKEKDNGKNKSKESPPTGRRKQKEYFKEELRRLEEGLKRESSKIKPPVVQEHVPYVFTNLQPYYNTYTVKYLIDNEEEAPKTPRDEVKYLPSRPTATGLVDPWLDLKMDTDMPELPPKEPTPPKEKKKPRSNEKRPPTEGSTRLPKYPSVKLNNEADLMRDITYNDVPALREELKKSYSSNAQRKIDEDYTKTKQDFYRMQLDCLDEVHPTSRPHMRSAYFAYLQNTPGSKKAVHECVAQLVKKDNSDDSGSVSGSGKTKTENAKTEKKSTEAAEKQHEKTPEEKPEKQKSEPVDAS